MISQKCVYSHQNERLSAQVKLRLTAGFILLMLLFSQASLASTKQQARIVGGIAAGSTQFPWQVAMVRDIDDPYNSQFCGGSIIHERWILTAAHCYDAEDTDVFVIAGITDLENITSGEKSAVSRWILHPNYDEERFDNDIALIELATPLNLEACGNRCLAIDLVTNIDEASVAALSTQAFISGWGNTVGGDGEREAIYPAKLQWASINILDCITSPAEYLESEITQNMLCAGSANFNKDSCQGDSGGPLAVADSTGTGYLLAGIVSWGNGCAVQGYPGVFSRVSRYTSWIYSSTEGDCCASPLVETPTFGKAREGGGGGGGGSSEGALLMALLTLHYLRRCKAIVSRTRT